MSNLSYDYDAHLDPPSTEKYDLMVESVCDMNSETLRFECDCRCIDMEGKTLENLRDELIDRMEWEDEL